MNESVQITDPEEIAAVERGEVDGDIYRDGECWANDESLRQWRQLKRWREEQGE